MSQTFAFVNEPILLWAQLSDKAASLPKYVRAEVYNPSDVLVATINLTSKGDGYFSDTSVIMPNVAFLRAEITVYSDAGYTIPDDTYDVVTDVYKRFADQSSGGLDTDQELVAFVEEVPVIQACFDSQTLCADIGEPTTMFAEFGDNDSVTAIMENNNIVAEISEGA